MNVMFKHVKVNYYGSIAVLHKSQEISNAESEAKLQAQRTESNGRKAQEKVKKEEEGAELNRVS